MQMWTLSVIIRQKLVWHLQKTPSLTSLSPFAYLFESISLTSSRPDLTDSVTELESTCATEIVIFFKLK